MTQGTDRRRQPIRGAWAPLGKRLEFRAVFSRRFWRAASSRVHALTQRFEKGTLTLNRIDRSDTCAHTLTHYRTHVQYVRCKHSSIHLVRASLRTICVLVARFLPPKHWQSFRRGEKPPRGKPWQRRDCRTTASWTALRCGLHTRKRKQQDAVESAVSPAVLLRRSTLISRPSCHEMPRNQRRSSNRIFWRPPRGVEMSR